MPCVDIQDSQFDAVIVVTDKIEKLTDNLVCLQNVLQKHKKVNISS